MAKKRQVGVTQTAQSTEIVLAWHWVATNAAGYPVLRDGNTVVETGQTYRMPGDETPKLCERGFHASERALDALQYAPGATICRVRLSGQIVRDKDKLVAGAREVLWLADATRTLHEFACDVAEAALVAERDAGREPDARSWEAIAVKRRWLTDDATDEQLAAARDAARDAAWAAARAAASAAARDAARDAAWAAARAAAWERFNALLEERLMALDPTTSREEAR